MLACAVGLVAPVVLYAQARTDRIALAEGKPKVVAGTIQAYASKTYVLSVLAGQWVSINLRANNRSNYMNVTASGAKTAMFVGLVQGDRYDFVAPATNDYLIEVHLMRNAARRHERASYALSVAQR
ncbi:hypothetical protein HL653_22970 [Sphingomonas sp. AP4-R1]|uniref:hypothetical protein n=1 Tax=Sphingomonas sp. AP4-R1 TaxID=2735134 RepID=UPI00149384C1|nr:hypothetical protein [Sphingomonas sp. AP4-R1]QJU60220.1 hypothetical protein HL653_22970 [Sphingomonas sp. AP4-R1]